MTEACRTNLSTCGIESNVRFYAYSLSSFIGFSSSSRKKFNEPPVQMTTIEIKSMLASMDRLDLCVQFDRDLCIVYTHRAA